MRIVFLNFEESNDCRNNHFEEKFKKIVICVLNILLIGNILV